MHIISSYIPIFPRCLLGNLEAVMKEQRAHLSVRSQFLNNFSPVRESRVQLT